MTNTITKWRIVVALLLSKLADILLSAKTTLPTLMNAVGAPNWMLGLLVPIRESGSLLPQALMSAWLSTKENRRAFWVASMVIQLMCMLTLIFIPLLLLPSLDIETGAFAGGIVLISLLVLSLARAMTSLTMKDIQGEHIEKGKRGNLVGIASTAAGILSLLFATLSFLSENLSEHILIVIGIICVLSMIMSTLTLVSLKTKVQLKKKANKGDHQNDEGAGLGIFSKSTITDYIQTFSGSLGRFIMVRAMFVHTALIAPFFIVWASNLLPQNGIITLSSFIIAQAGATILSSFIWGSLSDRNAKLSMQLGAAIVLFFSLLSALLNEFLLAMHLHPLWFIMFYFLISVGYEGTRAGRKVYALDLKEGAERTEFIGKANTVIGVVVIVLGLFYSALAMVGETLLFLVMAAGLGGGLFLSLNMQSEK